ncbi:SGNH hydrolase-type esterase domain-containing protein [Phaeosphaeriaceae sp. PMI808]|nr:SGNH hydrolase-type esterase domain-containing protein [Phaeosphaeriaceae sp. PMI808]
MKVLYIDLLAFTALFHKTFAHPHKSWLNATHLDVRDEPKFIIGTIGDSWASGVTYAPCNQYDDNSSKSMRYKYAWSTMVNAGYAQWTPDTSKEPEFEFRACSGVRLENMEAQMDQFSRLKLVLMEAGGNNADFYPMAISCLFQPDPGHDYGKNYEDDTDPNNREGNVEGDGFNDKVKRVTATIHTWRGHRSVMNSDATLFVLGYARFFAPDLDDACDDWNFVSQWRVFSKPQKLMKGMRQDFNDLLDSMNRAIRQAVESFNDEKIQYVDINPAFEGHRFCEKGHSKLDQYNWGSVVYFWNQPAKLFITIKDGAGKKTYNISNGDLPPQEMVDRLKTLQSGEPRQEGDTVILPWTNQDHPELSMEWRHNIQDVAASSTEGSLSRTLHPKEGHQETGNIIIQQLKKYYGRDDKVLSIIMQNARVESPGGPNDNSWLFFQTSKGESPLCHQETTAMWRIFREPQNANIDNPPLLGGIYPPESDPPFRMKDMDCRYKNDRTNAGALWCNDKQFAYYEMREQQTRNCGGGPITYRQRPVVYCEF